MCPSVIQSLEHMASWLAGLVDLSLYLRDTHAPVAPLRDQKCIPTPQALVGPLSCSYSRRRGFTSSRETCNGCITPWEIHYHFACLDHWSLNHSCHSSLYHHKRLSDSLSSLSIYLSPMIYIVIFLFNHYIFCSNSNFRRFLQPFRHL